jgi:Na+-translocating ferredoxin:NAD+ oxidoreductase RnfD subunit
MVEYLLHFLKNPQLHHLINLFILLFLAKEYAYLYLDWSKIVSIIVFALLSESAISWINTRQIKKYPFSSITTAIGVILMVYSTHIWLYFILIFISILQKYIIKIQNRHIFNPSNFAIFILLLTFDNFGGVSGGTLGHNLNIAFLVILLGIFILIRVNRWILPLGFTIFYLIFEISLVTEVDNTIFIEDIFEKFYSVSFILFILFMLTDPLTTPKNPIHQIIFAIFIAILSTTFDYFWGMRVEHIFLALTLSSPLILLLESDRLKEFFIIESILTLLSLFILFKNLNFMGVPN